MPFLDFVKAKLEKLKKIEPSEIKNYFNSLGLLYLEKNQSRWADLISKSLNASGVIGKSFYDKGKIDSFVVSNHFSENGLVIMIDMALVKPEPYSKKEQKKNLTYAKLLIKPHIGMEIGKKRYEELITDKNLSENKFIGQYFVFHGGVTEKTPTHEGVYESPENFISEMVDRVLARLFGEVK